MSAQRRREPILKIPGVLVALLGLMILVQIARSLMGDEADAHFIALTAFVPARFTLAWDPRAVVAALAAMSVDNRETAIYFLQNGLPKSLTTLTYAFVHDGWLHLGMNSVWFVAFGSPLARRLGAWRFVFLFCVAAIGGAFAHWFMHRVDFEPLVGASAGVSGVMAAAALFVFQPGAPLNSRLAAEQDQQRSRAVAALLSFRDPRALIFIAMWFFANSIGGFIAPLGVSPGAIAWEAHIGGFLTGLVLFPILEALRFGQPLPPVAENAAVESELG